MTGICTWSPHSATSVTSQRSTAVLQRAAQENEPTPELPLTHYDLKQVSGLSELLLHLKMGPMTPTPHRPTAGSGSGICEGPIKAGSPSSPSFEIKV